MKQRRTKAKPFKQLQEEWNAKLKTSGFQDIEDTSRPDRPLKEWHSTKFCSERSRIRQAQREKYNKAIDDFINSESINEICELIARHGNSAFSAHQVKRVLELHREGLDERKIAKAVRRGKTSVHLVLTKAKEWMKVA